MDQTPLEVICDVLGCQVPVTKLDDKAVLSIAVNMVVWEAARRLESAGEYQHARELRDLGPIYDEASALRVNQTACRLLKAPMSSPANAAIAVVNAGSACIARFCEPTVLRYAVSLLRDRFSVGMARHVFAKLDRFAEVLPGRLLALDSERSWALVTSPHAPWAINVTIWPRGGRGIEHHSSLPLDYIGGWVRHATCEEQDEFRAERRADGWVGLVQVKA